MIGYKRFWVRLNAPENFPWTDSDVVDEKVDAFFGGFMAGLFVGVTVMVIALVIFQ